MFATITKKQAGVIFGAWKRGEIEATKVEIDMIYGRFVGSTAPTTDSKMLDCASKLRTVVDSIFNGSDASEAFRAFIDCYKRSFNDSIYDL